MADQMSDSIDILISRADGDPALVRPELIVLEKHGLVAFVRQSHFLTTRLDCSRLLLPIRPSSFPLLIST